jgi:hemolysin D
MSASTGAISPQSVKALTTEADSSVLEYLPASHAMITLPVPIFARRVTLIVSAMVVMAITVFAVMPMQRIVSAPGRMVTMTPSVSIQPLETSIVRDVLVHEGETVKAGDLLARLDPTFSGSDENQYKSQLRSFGAQAERAQAELDGVDYKPSEVNESTTLQRSLFLQRKMALASQLAGYQQKIASLEQTAQRAASDLAGYTTRLRIATDVSSMRKQLETLQVGSHLTTLGAEDTRIDLQRQVTYNEAMVKSTQADLAAMLHERDYTAQNWRSETSKELAEAQRQMIDANQGLSKSRLRSQLVEMRASKDGIIQWVAKVTVGSVVQSGEQLVVLVPDDARFQIEARVPGNEIGFVAVGQHVMIALDTLNPTIYGYADGTVTSLSPDSFFTPEGGTTASTQSSSNQGGLSSGQVGSAPSGGNGGGEGYYRARISIDKRNFQSLPHNFRFMPGMTLSADINVGKRTVMTYLLGRAGSTFENAMSEP